MHAQLLKEITILYAEDETQTRINITKTLELICGKVISVGDGKEALKAYEKNAPHIVMLDYVMPLLDGAQVAQAIRKQNSTIPIFIASSYTDKDKLMNVMGLDLVDYLEKPLDLQILQTTLKACVYGLYENQGLIVKLKTNKHYDTLKKEILDKELKISLTTKEYKLLDLLLAHKGAIVSTQDIEEALYPDGAQKNTLRNLIYRLRTKCGAEAISTINDRGYTLCVASL